MKKFENEREGQIKFFATFRIDYENNEILINNTDGVVNGNLLEFKLNINDINKVLFQAIKYLSKMRIKGQSVPSNILLISLNEEVCYHFKSEDYFDEIHQVYYGGASKDNGGFLIKSEPNIINYSNNNHLQQTQLLNLLKIDDYMPIRIDENCIVGWAKRYYKENPTAKKGDFLGDTECEVRIIGEIREPRYFKGQILPYEGKTNEKFKYLMDMLNDDLSKKELGAYYTPIEYCKKAAELVRKAIAYVPKGNDYVIIDRCAGTGNLESVLTDEELSHCILSTYEYYEYKVLVERLGDKVRHIIPPVETEDTYDKGFVRTANALSKEYIENEVVNQYIKNDKCTIILYENPPFQDSSSITFIEDNDLTKRAKTNRNETYVRDEFKKTTKTLNEQKGVSRDICNLFIWSGFNYYLRQPTDSYIVFAPIKYFKSIWLVEKEFGGGFAFNKKHFHATNSTVSCIWWKNIDNKTDTMWELETYDLDEISDTNGGKKHKLTRIDNDVIVKKCFKNVAEYNDKRKFPNDKEMNVVCRTNGYENTSWVYKKGRKPIFNENIIAYLTCIGFPVNRNNYNLVRCNLKKGLENSYGFHLRSDNFLEKLPIFCAKCFPQKKWYETDVYYTPADGGNQYIKDKEFLKECLIYTCLTFNNRCISFVATNGKKFDNELCFDSKTLASNTLKEFKLNSDEIQLLELWKTVLNESKKTKNYDSEKKYGIYQISKELNTAYKNDKKKKCYHYPILNGSLEALETKLDEYYNKYILPKLFDYQLLK